MIQASNTNPLDAFDSGPLDAPFLNLGTVRLSGGSGFPSDPSSEETGPFRSLIHVLNRENELGVLEKVNVTYEWAGDSSASGTWQPFSLPVG